VPVRPSAFPKLEQFNGGEPYFDAIADAHIDLLGLAITEGVEDGLSIHQATGLGVWVAGSAPHMGKLDGVKPDFSDAVVPDYIDSVSIFADADADHQGERNAKRLAERLRARGIEVTIEGLDA